MFWILVMQLTNSSQSSEPLWSSSVASNTACHNFSGTARRLFQDCIEHSSISEVRSSYWANQQGDRRTSSRTPRTLSSKTSLLPASSAAGRCIPSSSAPTNASTELTRSPMNAAACPAKRLHCTRAQLHIKNQPHASRLWQHVPLACCNRHSNWHPCASVGSNDPLPFADRARLRLTPCL